MQCLTIFQYILSKTESRQVIAKDAEIFFCSILILLSSENNAMKTKACGIFNSFMSMLKKSIELSSIDVQLQLSDQTNTNEEDLYAGLNTIFRIFVNN